MKEIPIYLENEKLSRQICFLVEIDKIKNIVRKSKLFDGSRFENDAEHSWTISIMAVLLREYSNFAVDIEKVVTMLLIHDIVEIDAGDTFLYSAERHEAYAKEKLSAERLFGILDVQQRDKFLQLWEEFEERSSDEAKFAAVFDRVEPLLQNYINEGFTWKKNNITYEMVISVNKHIEEGSKAIWKFVQFIIEDAVQRGYLKKGQESNI